MGYDEKLAARVRGQLADVPGVVERRMFGGAAFMVGGHMCCGVVRDDLMVRVGPDEYEDLLRKPHARVMDFTGRPLRGMVYVDSGGVKTAKALRTWIGRGLAFVRTLPPK